MSVPKTSKASVCGLLEARITSYNPGTTDSPKETQFSPIENNDDASCADDGVVAAEAIAGTKMLLTYFG